MAMPPMHIRPRCAYHGWRFDSDGKCLSIPQSERGGKDEAQDAACTKVYPTQVRQSERLQRRPA